MIQQPAYTLNHFKPLPVDDRPRCSLCRQELIDDKPKLLVDLNSNFVSLGIMKWHVQPQFAVFLHLLVEKWPKAVETTDVDFAFYGNIDHEHDVRRICLIYACQARKMLRPIGGDITSERERGFRLVLPHQQPTTRSRDAMTGVKGSYTRRLTQLADTLTSDIAEHQRQIEILSARRAGIQEAIAALDSEVTESFFQEKEVGKPAAPTKTGRLPKGYLQGLLREAKTGISTIDLVTKLTERGFSVKPNVLGSQLSHYVKKGIAKRLDRGLYTAVNIGNGSTHTDGP